MIQVINSVYRVDRKDSVHDGYYGFIIILLIVNNILNFLRVSIQEKAYMVGHVFGNEGTLIRIC